MDDTERNLPIGDAEWLRERSPADHVESDESVRSVLTNRAVGVHREGDEETVHLPPGDEYGALAIVTDRRVLVLVGDCPEREGDVVMPIPHEIVVDAAAETETLTERFVLETQSDVAWAFTAREAGETGDVAAFVTDASTAWRAVEAHLEDVEAARDDLETALGEGEPADCEDAIDRARTALEPIRAALSDVDLPVLDERVDPLAEHVDELAATYHRREAERLAETAEEELAAYEYEAGHEHLETAAEHVDRAGELVTDAWEPLTAADGGATIAATEEHITELRDSLKTQPLDDATSHRQRAAEAEERDERIQALEQALVCYRNAASLVAAESPFEGDEATARDDALAVIDDLVEELRAAGEEAATAAEWMQEADNQTSAYKLYTEARDHYERALELADSYPPGDADAIRDDLAAVGDAIDPLEIKMELESVDDELE